MPSQLYYNGVIVTVDCSRRIILGGAIVVVDGRIAAVGKDEDVRASGLATGDVHEVDLCRRIVIPGLINAHVHLIQSLMRGLAEDLNLHDWASCAIWPMEVSYRREDSEAAAKLAVTEMLKSGTTCFLEPMLPSFADNEFSAIVQTVGELGIRACLGKLVMIPRTNQGAGISDSRDNRAKDMSVNHVVEAHKRFHGAFDGRINIWMAPETPRGQDESGFRDAGLACTNHDIRVTVHCAEAAKDSEFIARNYSASPAQFLQNNHLTGEHVVLGHMVHLDEPDFAILRDTKTSVAHNPTSNAKLSDGIAPIPRLLAEGVNVCIGSDGAPCNNIHDLFRDMHLAGIIHKGRTTDPGVLPAEQVLEMATINGAKALGLEKEIGSLEVGKKADFVVLNHHGLHTAPYDPESLKAGGLPVPTLVVHSLSGRDVDMVVVDGNILVVNGKFATINEEEVICDAKDAIERIRKRSLVVAQPLKRGWHYV